MNDQQNYNDPLGLAAPFLLMGKIIFFKIYVRTTAAGMKMCLVTSSKIGKAGKFNFIYWKVWS